MNIIKETYQLLPNKIKPKIKRFLIQAFINNFLDLISIGTLIPLILFILDKEKFELMWKNYFGADLTNTILFFTLCLIIIFFVLKNLIQIFILRQQNKFTYNIANEISKNLSQKFIYNDYSNYNKADKNKLIQDILKVPIDFVKNVFLQLIFIGNELTLLLLIIIISLFFSFKITILIIGILSLLFYTLTTLKKKKLKFLDEKVISKYHKTISNLTNILFGYLEIKSSKSEDILVDKFYDSNLFFNDEIANLDTLKQNNSKYLEIFLVVIILSFVIFSILYNVKPNIIIIAFFASSMVKILPSLNKILNSLVNIKSHKHTLTALKGYNYKSQSKTDYSFTNTIHFENIHFNYDDNSIINNLNLTIKKGEVILIKGVSGVGKSTLLKIILGLIEPKNGTTLIDKQEFKYNNQIHSFASYLPQDTFLFQASLIDNITMFKKYTDDDLIRIENLLEKLSLKKWFSSLNNGFETMILNNDIKLSGGEKQRLGLLRVLYQKPSLLILDEFTNQLNNELKTNIIEFIIGYAVKNKITLIISSHSTILDDYVNRSLHLKNGKLINNN